ncbi:MAG: methyltransferase domain-containing protein [Cycloclasticus sp.]
MSSLQQKWDDIYRKQAITSAQAATVVSRYAHLLPTQGKALDLACGLGGNAFLLAKQGLDVDAWDISAHAIDEINKRAADGPPINALAIDISQARLTANHYDVITVSRFLERKIIPQLINALKPTGLLFYQTFTVEKARAGGPTNPAYLLKKGELLSLFSNLSLVAYHEEGNLGNIGKGIRNEALLVAQR